MKIAVIGAPGSGKTFLSKKIAEQLNLTHIESDAIFWKGTDLRSGVDEKTEGDDWIIEGHMSKIHDIVFPKADKILIVEGSAVLSLLRATRRDWRNLKKAWYNIQFYDRLSKIRNELIKSVLNDRPQDVIFLENFPNIGGDELQSFCERLVTPLTKTPGIRSKEYPNLR